MANVSRKGFFPLDGKEYENVLFPVDSSSATNMFVGDVVKAVANGAVNPSAAGDATIVVGTVLELFDSNRRPCGGWMSSVTTKYLPSSTAGYALVALALPGRRFVAQSDTVLTTAAIFASTDHVAGSGSTTTGQSGHTLNGADLNTGGQVFYIDYVNTPTNDITLANAKWIVMFNEGILMGTGKTTGV